MVTGLKEVDAALREKQVPLYLLRGNPAETVPKLAMDMKAAARESLFRLCESVLTLMSAAS